MKIKLEHSGTFAQPHLPVYVYWKSCAPFVKNTRGKLLHRVRWVEQIDKEKHGVHIHANYWCGNGSNSDLVGMTLHFIEHPDENDILCAKCEEAAIHAGKESAFALAGYHVHTGRCVARADCHNIEIEL